MINNIGDSFGINLNESNNNTPYRNITNSQMGTPIEYNNVGFPNPLLQSNGKAEIDNISDEKELNKIFEEQEYSIKKYCSYYKSLRNIFELVNKDIKNELIKYLGEFNNNCKYFSQEKTNKLLEAHKNMEDINQIRENYNKLKTDYNKLNEKFNIEKKELILNYNKKIEELQNKIKNLENEINKNKNATTQNKKQIEEKFGNKKPNIYIGYIGPILGASCGPGMLAAYFIGKEVTYFTN